MTKLFMQVEPADASYMPSLVVVSGGDTVHSLKEIKTVNIGANETLVEVLCDVTEVNYWSKACSVTSQAACVYNIK